MASLSDCQSDQQLDIDLKGRLPSDDGLSDTRLGSDCDERIHGLSGDWSDPQEDPDNHSQASSSNSSVCDDDSDAESESACGASDNRHNPQPLSDPTVPAQGSFPQSCGESAPTMQEAFDAVRELADEIASGVDVNQSILLEAVERVTAAASAANQPVDEATDRAMETLKNAAQAAGFNKEVTEAAAQGGKRWDSGIDEMERALHNQPLVSPPAQAAPLWRQAVSYVPGVEYVFPLQQQNTGSTRTSGTVKNQGRMKNSGNVSNHYGADSEALQVMEKATRKSVDSEVSLNREIERLQNELKRKEEKHQVQINQLIAQEDESKRKMMEQLQERTDELRRQETKDRNDHLQAMAKIDAQKAIASTSNDKVQIRATADSQKAKYIHELGLAQIDKELKMQNNSIAAEQQLGLAQIDKELKMQDKSMAAEQQSQESRQAHEKHQASASQNTDRLLALAKNGEERDRQERQQAHEMEMLRCQQAHALEMQARQQAHERQLALAQQQHEEEMYHKGTFLGVAGRVREAGAAGLGTVGQGVDYLLSIGPSPSPCSER